MELQWLWRRYQGRPPHFSRPSQPDPRRQYLCRAGRRPRFQRIGADFFRHQHRHYFHLYLQRHIHFDSRPERRGLRWSLGRQLHRLHSRQQWPRPSNCLRSGRQQRSYLGIRSSAHRQHYRHRSSPERSTGSRTLPLPDPVHDGGSSRFQPRRRHHFLGRPFYLVRERPARGQPSSFGEFRVQLPDQPGHGDGFRPRDHPDLRLGWRRNQFFLPATPVPEFPGKYLPGPRFLCDLLHPEDCPRIGPRRLGSDHLCRRENGRPSDRLRHHHRHHGQQLFAQHQRRHRPQQNLSHLDRVAARRRGRQLRMPAILHPHHFVAWIRSCERILLPALQLHLLLPPLPSRPYILHKNPERLPVRWLVVLQVLKIRNHVPVALSMLLRTHTLVAPFLLLRCQHPRQHLHKRSDLVPHSPINRQLLLAIGHVLCQLRRVFEADMNLLRLPGKNRAMLVGMTADGDDIVEVDWPDVFERLRVMPGEVHARFRHDFDGVRVHAVLFDARRIRLDDIAFEMARPALGHLAATGITSAKEQHFHLRSWRWHIVLGSSFKICFSFLRSCPTSGVSATDFCTQTIVLRTTTGAFLPGSR